MKQKNAKFNFNPLRLSGVAKQSTLVRKQRFAPRAMLLRISIASFRVPPRLAEESETSPSKAKKICPITNQRLGYMLHLLGVFRQLAPLQAFRREPLEFVARMPRLECNGVAALPDKRQSDRSFVRQSRVSKCVFPRQIHRFFCHCEAARVAQEAAVSPDTLPHHILRGDV